MFQAFFGGHLSVQLSNGNPFSVDHTTELTVKNRHTYTKWYNKWSLKSSAVKLYNLTSEQRSAFLGQMKEMGNGNKTNVRRVDLQQTRITKDEEGVSSITGMSDNQSWVKRICHIQSPHKDFHRKNSAPEYSHRSKRAWNVADNCYSNLKTERLEDNPQIKKFHDPIKLNKLKTFTNQPISYSPSRQSSL